MADFNQLRNNLNQARNQKEQTRISLFKEKERLLKIQREKDALERIFKKENKEHVRRRKQLQALEQNTLAQISEWSISLKGDIKNEFGIFQKFTPFTDPREHLGRLNDNYPILLMPIRIETRFKKIDAATTGQHQLWVRIFPDECAIDTFESVPSESELKNTQFYWSTLWQAGGHEDLERAAWRSLVSSHGSGRASWLIKNYQPENITDQPVKTNIEDVILVISVTELPPATDIKFILDFWKSFWLADGNKELEEKAFNTLAIAVSKPVAIKYIDKYIPDNLKQKPNAPKTKADVNLNAVFLDFPIINQTDTKNQSWSQAPKTTVLPERFVLVGYENNKVAFEKIGSPIPSPLIMGPDPSLDDSEQIKQENGEIIVNEDIKWMVDFDEAIKKGLGFKINITSTQAKRGFNKIVALGVRLGSDEAQGAEQLEELIEHHKNSRKGFSILPQGTATNNTEKEGSGYKTLDDPDVSFDNLRKEKLFDLTTDWMAKKDGQWLSESLGISADVIQNVMNSDGTDQCEARAMNTALWPATMGYMMESLMQPVFSDQDIETTRTFFNHLVLGRGTVPAIKIGKQPYGIYPTTAFSKIGWIKPRGRVPSASHFSVQINANVFSNYISRLYNIIKKIDADWTKDHLSKVGYVGKQGDAHQILLDIVGLNPNSVEFHQRYAESFDQLKNRLSFFGAIGTFLAIIIAGSYVKSGKDLLAEFGFTGEETPDILEKIFLKNQNLLKGALIDDVPLSEIAAIRNYTPEPDEHNYIQWLINSASTSHNILRKQDGFIDNKIPSSLLYLMLHHALDLNFVEVGLKLHLQAKIISVNQVRAAKLEPSFLHIAENVKESESKWQYLYKKDSRITGNQDIEIGEYIPTIINTSVATAYLKKQLDALKYLENTSTAKLERAFVEHLDLCSYRLDAWKSGLMNYQLSLMRRPVSGETKESYYKRGVYLGAYGILEDIKSENKNLTEIKSLDKDLEKTFIDPDSPLYRDDTNGGYIAAPSLNHAVTAAILRNGYMENASQSNPDLLSVNLSSERVRKSLGLIEGIRGGQSLAELLGYQLERGLHDQYPGLELDFYIYELRRAFPLRANRLKDTQTSDDTAIEEIEARNVVDGLRLINHLKTLPKNAVYPYGKSLSTDGITPAITNAIKAEVNKIQDLNDAIADVAIAESVHQVVQGNYDRGAATLNTYSKGNFPPIPDVIQTPRSGVNLTHRFGIHLESGLDLNTSPIAGIPMTARAKAEPALNSWLSTILPSADEVACKVNYFDHADELEKEVVITQKMLQLQALDLLYLLNIDMDQAIAQVDDLLIQHVTDAFSVRPDADIKIKYMEKIPGKINFFELSPMINSLRSIVLSSRPLEAQDVARPTEDNSTNISVWQLDKQRIVINRNSLDSIKTTAEALFATITLLTESDTLDLTQIINQSDSWSDGVVSIMKDLYPFGNPQATLGLIHDGKANIFRLVISKVEKVVERFEGKLVNFQIQMDKAAIATTDEKKIEIMIGAEREINTESTIPVPASPAAYEGILIAQKLLFTNKLNSLKAIVSSTTTSVTTLYTNLKTELPLSDFDYEELDIVPIQNQILLFATELASRLQNLITDLGDRITKVDGFIADHDAATVSKKQIQALENAGKTIFGDDFKMFHEFSLSDDQGDEWENSINAKAQLLNHSLITEHIDFPMDDWLYGLARVREKLHHWENIVFLNEAYEGAGLELEPVQLPHKKNDHWLGLSYPEGYDISEDKLLYTAFYSTPFDKNKNQCGLLIDEWTELIPSEDETAGITFHYDRPNSEPPQVMLLAMPTDFSGEWQWTDLVDTVLETLEMAKKRAIEPDQIDSSKYARFLPTTVSSSTTRAITPSLNYSFNNRIHELLNNNGN